MDREYGGGKEDLLLKIEEVQREKEIYHLKNIELRKRISDLELENQRLLNLSQNDGLTGIPNRRRFDEYLEIEWMRGRREISYLSLIIIDIDYFKEFNDHYGHLKGDHCLLQVANGLKGSLKRPGDFLARYGGDEFVAVLPHTDLTGALSMAEEMRRRIEDIGIVHQRSPVSDIVSITLGVATIIPNGQINIASFIHMADLALYQAKKKGRNQVASFI